MANVLIVIPDHKYGGEENRSYRIYRGLKSDSFKVSFVTESSDYVFDNDELITLPNLDNTKYLPLNIAKLYFLIKRNKYDVVLLFKRKSCFVGWVLEKLLKDTRFIFNVANAWQSKKTLWRFSPEYICTLSKRLIPNFVLSTKHVHQISIGVPIVGAKILTNGCVQQPVRLISAGKLNYQKNHLQLMYVAKALQEKGFTVVVDIAGDGPMRSDLENAALRLGVNLCLRGQVSDMQEFYEQGGIYVQVSNFEGMPNALLEAGQYGIPIVANNVGATEDIINDETGWLISSSSIASYTEAISNILTTPGEVLRRTGLMREKVIRCHNVDTMCNEYKRYVNSFLDVG